MMAIRRPRALLAALSAAALVVGGSAAPVAAENPPPVWQSEPGHPVVVDGLEVAFETAMLDDNPWGIWVDDGGPVPYVRPTILNASAEVRHVGFGMDIAAEGVVEPLWEVSTWGEVNDQSFADMFAVTLAPGESLAEVSPGIAGGVPQWSGRTFVVFELSGPPATAPTELELVSFDAPGRFVPVGFAQFTAEGIPSVGQPLEVTGPASAELFPGLTANVAATGLTPGEELDLWLAPEFDYFFLFLLGGALPSNAVPVGSGTVAADGTLSATFAVPSTTAFGDYQLVAGSAQERYWPAGSRAPFSIVEPGATGTVATPTDGAPATVAFASTAVTFTFPAGTGEGTTTATVSATGPVPGEFTLASDPPLYYHLDTTSTLTGDLLVCIAYDPVTLPGDPPRLYHYTPVQGGYTWDDITTTSIEGEVCGVTSSLSPFALGHPVHDGSTAAPANAVLTHDNGHDGLRDGDYTVTLDLRQGGNARVVRLLEDGVVIARQQLVLDSPNAQRVAFPITGRSNGSYRYTAELVNSTGLTTTMPLTVTVADAAPATPVLTVTGSRSGAVSLTAALRWGTNATSAQFFENGVPVGAAIALTPATPNPQSASLELARAPGQYVYSVAFSNAAGTTSSVPVTVRVR